MSPTRLISTANASTRVGLLGGGQLARMLILKGHEMGLIMQVFCASVTDPAAQVTPHVTIGNLNDSQALIAFAKDVDVLTFESEFMDGDILTALSKASPKTPLYPSVPLLISLQDRLPQKQALQKHKVPTAEFKVVSSQEDLQAAADYFKNQFVLKKRRGGYDGYGTWMVRSKKDLAKLPAVDAEKSGYIAEAFVPFRRELALQIARNVAGQCQVFPLVETKQVDHRLDWLQGPIAHKGVADLSKNLVRMVKAMDYVGVIAFELFDTGRELLVNEIAPRVHNSGHASLEALSVDQFTQHLRAILNLELSVPKVLGKGFACANLIGRGADLPQFPKKNESHLHWYGKTESRTGRKMGHLTHTGPDAATCLRQVLKDRKGFRL